MRGTLTTVYLSLIPTVFYRDLQIGVELFGDAIGLAVLHRDDDLVVLGRGHVKVYLGRAADPGERPELAIETDDIDAVHADIAGRRPDLLHPNLPTVTRRPWGPREFALLDATTVCVVFRDWT